MARCRCAGSECSCSLQAGTGITVSGSGALSDPYLISATGGGGGGGGTTTLPSRQQVTFTTASLAAGGNGTGTVIMAPGYRLYRISCSTQARVRLYTTTAKRTADVARPIGTDPTGDHGLMLEFVAVTGVLAADLSPLVDGFDGKTTPDGVIPYGVTNMGASSATVTVTFLWQKGEE